MRPHRDYEVLARLALRGPRRICETSRAVVVATETSELLHGNINFATAGVGVAVGTDDLSRRLGEEVLREAETRGAATYRLGMGDRQAPRSVSLPPTVPEWTPFLAMLRCRLAPARRFAGG